MTIMKIAAVGAVASLLLAGTAQASETRASVPAVSSVVSKKLVRTSAPVRHQARDADNAILAVAAAGAFGAGVYFLAKKNDSTGS
jgi:hypothetical protein